MTTPAPGTAATGVWGPLLAHPEDPGFAQRVVGALLLAGGVFMSVFALLVPAYMGDQPVIVGVAGALFIISGLICVVRPTRVWPHTVFTVALVSTGMIGLLNWATHDTTTGSQAFLIWPVLFSAMFLNRIQTAIVVLAMVVAETIVVAGRVPAWQAVTDVGSLATAVSFAAATVLILRGRAAQLRGALHSQAMQDQLTGLSNRRALDHSVATLRGGVGGSEHVAVLVVDIDRFKAINDDAGHSTGDEALRTVADALLAAVRRGDLVARVGGDEFVAVLTGADAEAGQRVAETIRCDLRARPGTPTVSVGVAEVVVSADLTVDALLRDADQALYAAKQAGRDRVVVSASDAQAPHDCHREGDRPVR